MLLFVYTDRDASITREAGRLHDEFHAFIMLDYSWLTDIDITEAQTSNSQEIPTQFLSQTFN